MAFFLYASLLMHPYLKSGNVPGEFRFMLLLVEYVIGLFSVLFILYSHSAFLKVRRKELGLLTVLGMLPGQITRLIHYENSIIGFGAITAGVGLGVVFSKLFFLAISRALDLPEPIPFEFSAQAVVVTYLVFGAIFALISLYGQIMLRSLPVAEVLRGASRPKPQPRFSLWLVALCVLSIGGAYGLALSSTGSNLERRLLPIMVLLLAGTYLLFTQSSVAILRGLQRNRGVYYRHTNLLTVSQMVHKMKDNSRILFMVTILPTLVLGMVGLYYGPIRPWIGVSWTTAPSASCW